MGKAIDQIKQPLGYFALALCLVSSTAAYALGFGEVRLGSALNQRLDARIPLTSVSPDERGSLTVRMAGPEAFERFGIERAAAIDKIELTVNDPGAPGGRVTVRLTSQSPIQAPFLNFLIVADTGDRRVLREYTVLLDPPGWPGAAPPVAAEPEATVSPAPRVAVSPSPAPNERPPAVAAIQSADIARRARDSDVAATPVAGPRQYGPVEAGDTLWRIASRTRFPGVSTQQMLLAIYRANPAAFDGSMNLLLKGSMLDIPSAEQVRAIDDNAARRILQAAQTQPAAPVVRTEAPPDPAPAPDPAPEDWPEPAIAAIADGGRLRLEAPRQFPTINRMDTALPPGDAATASVPSGDLTEPFIGPDFGTLSGPPVIAPSSSGMGANAGQVTAEAQPVRTAVAQGVEQPGADPGEIGPAGGASKVDYASAITGTGLDAGAAGEGAGLAPGNVRDVATAGRAGLLSPSNILLLLAALGLLIALLLWQRRRQYKPVPADFSAGFGAAEGYEANDVSDAPGAPGPAAPGDADGPLENTGVPAMAGVAPELQMQDAENQIAIGLLDQARTTIEDGLARYPGHAGLQDKLLELDYVNGDVDRFRADVERFRGVLVRSGVRWAGVSAMGRVLAPNDPRFAFGKSEKNTAADDEPSASPAPPDPAGSEAQTEVAPGDSSRTTAGPLPPAESATGHQEAWDGIEAPPEGEPQEEHNRATGAPAPATNASGPAPDAGAPEDPPLPGNGLDLDVEATNLSSPEWAAAPMGDSESRRDFVQDHAFDLDATAPLPPAETDANGRAVTHFLNDTAGDDDSSFDIDLSEFDLDDAADEDVPVTEDADPVEMRLDVARTYIEMDDSGSARGLLYEVMEDGNAEQRDTAQAMLSEI